MKIAWILNGLVGRAGVLYNGVESQSGGWINATYEQFREKIEDGTVDLHIVVPVTAPKAPVKDALGETYYFIKRESSKIGQLPTRNDICAINETLDKISPDCIMLWGTEYPLQIGASQYAKAHNIPLLLYVQGLIGSFEGNFNGRLSVKEMKKFLSLPDRIKLIQNYMFYRSCMKQKKTEDEIISQLYGVIGDNEWCFSFVKNINPDVKCFKHFLPVNELFCNADWSPEKAHKNEIFTIAGRTAYKGLHNLIKALPAVKEQFPDVRVYIPGYMGYGSPAFLKRPPYIAYLNALIKKCGVSDNVVFLGKLDAKQMREHIENCACFVMPSIVENHSSSLREAMLVGAPCVSSLVGSVGEFTEQGVSGSVYECDDYKSLSDEIIKILSNPEYAKTIAQGGKKSITDFYSKDSYKNVYEIYKEVLSK